MLGRRFRLHPFGVQGAARTGRSVGIGEDGVLIQPLGQTQLPNQVGQGLALDELHGVVIDAAFAADGIDRHDVGVMQMRGGLGLVLEAVQVLGVERRGKGQHLQSHPAPEGKLHGLVDNPHTAPADLAEDAEIAQRQPGLPHRCRSGPRFVGLRFQLRGRRVHHIQAIEATGQRRGDVGVCR